MNTKTYTGHTYSCDTCNWQVPMVYEQGAISAYVTNKSLRDLHKHAETRYLHEAPAVNTDCKTYCRTCNSVVAKS